MRIFTSCILFVLLLLIHTSQGNSTVQMVHTYVPPLTHTPGLGLSMMGSHPEPPFMILEVIQQRTSDHKSITVGSLFQKHKAHLDDGVHLRLHMQRQTQLLLEQLPADFVHQAWKERLKHEERIGEVRVWTTLLNSTK